MEDEAMLIKETRHRAKRVLNSDDDEDDEENQQDDEDNEENDEEDEEELVIFHIRTSRTHN